MRNRLLSRSTVDFERFYQRRTCVCLSCVITFLIFRIFKIQSTEYSMYRTCDLIQSNSVIQESVNGESTVVGQFLEIRISISTEVVGRRNNCKTYPSFTVVLESSVVPSFTDGFPSFDNPLFSSFLSCTIQYTLTAHQTAEQGEAEGHRRRSGETNKQV